MFSSGIGGANSSLSTCIEMHDPLKKFQNAVQSFEKIIHDQNTTGLQAVNAYVEMDKYKDQLNLAATNGDKSAQALLAKLDEMKEEAKSIDLKIPTTGADSGVTNLTDTDGKPITLADVIDDVENNKNPIIQMQWTYPNADQGNHGNTYAYNVIADGCGSYSSTYLHAWLSNPGTFKSMFPSLPTSAMAGFEASAKDAFDHSNESAPMCRHAEGNDEKIDLGNGNKGTIHIGCLDDHMHTIGKYTMKGGIKGFLGMATLDFSKVPVSAGKNGGNDWGNKVKANEAALNSSLGI